MDGNFSLQNKKATKNINSHAYHCQYEMSQYITYEHFTCIYSKKFKRSMLLFSKELPIHIGKEIKARGRIPIPIAVP